MEYDINIEITGDYDWKLNNWKLSKHRSNMIISPNFKSTFLSLQMRNESKMEESHLESWWLSSVGDTIMIDKGWRKTTKIQDIPLG